MALMQSQQTLGTGNQAPDFSLPGIDGKTYSLSSFRDKKILVIIFMCNHCPYVIPKIETMKALQTRFQDQSVQLVGINSNDPVNYPDDSFENMKVFAQEHQLNFPYLFDESQEVAKAYDAVCTPDPFVFNQERKLIYQGRFDDMLSTEGTPTTTDMADAIEAILIGNQPKTDFLPSQGCSIKWK